MTEKLNEFIEKYNMNINGVIHIGAHCGQENTIYDSANIKNRIYFEPMSVTFDALKLNVGDKYILIKKALGNENKKMNMNISSNNGESNSLLKPLLHLKQYPTISFNTVEEVDMARLDDLGLDLGNYNFINIDVQGYELEVFKGSAKTLGNIDYIISELNRDEVYENCVRVEEMVDFLGCYGFELVEQNWDGGIWGDGLFIKTKK